MKRLQNLIAALAALCCLAAPAAAYPPHGLAGGGGGGGAATFVSKRTYNLLGAADALIPIPASAATGDVLVIAMVESGANNNATLKANGSGAFFTIGGGPDVSPSISAYCYLFWKILTVGDISTGTLTVANGLTDDPLVMSLYRGATTVTVQGFQQPGAATTTFSGFAPNVASLGVGASFVESGTPGALTITATGWTQRDGGPTSVAYWGDAILDRLSGYTNAPVGFSTFGGSTIIGYIYEFT